MDTQLTRLAIFSNAAAYWLESNAFAREGGLLATIIGLAAMLLRATTVFGQMQNSLNAIWGAVPKPSQNSLLLPLRKRVTSFIDIGTN